MPFTYMIFWTVIMVIALSLFRVRRWGQRLFLVAVTFLVLFVSQALFLELASAAGVNAQDALVMPGRFLQGGLLALLAWLVMPCGWLGPFMGLHLIERWQASMETAEAA